MFLIALCVSRGFLLFNFSYMLEKKDSEKLKDAVVEGPRAEVDVDRVHKDLLEVGVEKVALYRVEVLRSAELTDENLQEVTDFFRLVFNNYWPDYLYCPPCDFDSGGQKRFSASEIFGAKNETIPLEVMDNFSEGHECPDCDGELELMHDPEFSLKRMKEKLEKDGYVSLMRRNDDDRIVGFALGYEAKLRDEFEHEWGNWYPYAKEQNREYDRDFDLFLAQLKEHLDEGLEADTRVFCWNCVGKLSEVRGNESMARIMQGFFQEILQDDPSRADIYIVGEVLKGTPAHGIFKTVGGKDIPEILEGEDTIIAGPLGYIARVFGLDAKSFRKKKETVL